MRDLFFRVKMGKKDWFFSCDARRASASVAVQGNDAGRPVWVAGSGPSTHSVTA